MTRATILIVDDDPTILTIMSEILGPHYQVRATRKGNHALKVADTEPKPDLILLDVCMPEMDGYEVLSCLKEKESTADIPVIFVTSLEAREDIPKAFELGVVDFITKPFNSAVLLARTKNYITLKQAQDFLKEKATQTHMEVENRLKEYKIVLGVMLNSLAALMKVRPSDGEKSILRKQSFTRALGSYLMDYSVHSKFLSADYIEMLEFAVPLYDLGMLGIAKHVLENPGKLSHQEWEQVKKHPLLGVSAIENASINIEQPIEFLLMLKEIGACHHEHWDGSGYPNGIAGIEVPLSARIIAVIDVFDALISARVYRDALSFDDAREIISSERGLKFDPIIVDVFLDKYTTFVELAQ